ncbi:RHS repeat-associated core domain-containing protein [Pseudomonas sp. 14P_8.1_Bac3]|uniref:RHS repeat-associated core domain-containing protein n=1 Tax=Pseudomonas sp. 14P_8.1_Bac3 TaxID=2971621 RepID=UPI0021C67E8F|nr:RHS repeat-associated core domain-containing protein [Pseudomonas sp. 14P_8.1_Bac3]MCU1759088.1 RHS repeat-associated core domain-containing protein [Pseudomonas sp. 14P_8.1_Bac3]
MAVQREMLLCRYHYDPLDRVAGCAPLGEPSIQRFYRGDRLATEIQGQVQCSVFETEVQVLAQQKHQAGRVGCALLATDLQCSIFHSIDAAQHQQRAYSPYGHWFPEADLIGLLGFNGERRDSVTGHYLLGNGHRVFIPVLMRFNRPDKLSPFEKGGINAYAYCAGDPVNRVDPKGRYFVPAFVTGMVQGAFIQRVFNVLDTVSAAPSSIQAILSRGFRAGVKSVNDLRPAIRQAAANTERLESIADFQRLNRYTTESPPFTNTKSYVERTKKKVEEFIGPRYLENGPTLDFAKLLEDEALARATLSRVKTHHENLQRARERMDVAIRKWQTEMRFGPKDLDRVMRSALNLRNGP